MDFQAIKDEARGRCGEIIAKLTPLPSDVIRKGPQDHPCPVCGGKSVIWPGEGDANDHGRIACRNCTNDVPTGDIISTVAAFNGTRQGDAAHMVAEYLGIDARGYAIASTADIVEQVAKAKGMPVDAFRQFGVHAAQRGTETVARVPVYDSDGKPHSHFDMTPVDKGRLQKGNGSSGLFFPGKTPRAGETWILVEGVKDAAALVGLGYNACGLPGSTMHRKFASLFQGVRVTVVPDLDEAGLDGANKTAAVLFGIAESVSVARLPGEIRESRGEDVRDVIRRDGPGAIHAAIKAAPKWTPSTSGAASRPVLTIPTTASSSIRDAVIEHMGRWSNEQSTERQVYQRGGQLVEVITEQGTSARIRVIPRDQLLFRITDAVKLVTDLETEKTPPPWLINGIHTKGDFGDAVRPLTGIVTAPTIRPNGSVLQTPGWDSQTGLIYQPTIEFPPIPHSITQEDAFRAARYLRELVRDFPFREEADASAWIALVLTMIGRSAVSGSVPMFTVTANIRGSGKSLLVDLASSIAYACKAARTPPAKCDDELRKCITSVLIEGVPVVLIDNVTEPIGGAALDAVLTGERWRDRPLHKSSTVDLEIRTVFTATGNNMSYRGDFARRVIPIRLRSVHERPETRSGFAHPDLPGYVLEHRAELAVAALTLLRGYILAGCPNQPGGSFGSFEEWSSRVRGAIVWAGLDDPLHTRVTAQEEDESTAVVQRLVAGLQEIDESGEGMYARDIIRVLNAAPDRYQIMRDLLSEHASNQSGEIDAMRLGRLLNSYCDRPIGGYRIAKVPGRSGSWKWSAQRVKNGDGGVAND